MMHGIRGRFPKVLCAALLCVSGPLFAQYVERVDVSIANVDVVVTDRDGKPVHGLTRDDFIVHEDGKLQTITNFSALQGPGFAAVPQESGEVPSSSVVPSRPRIFVLFIDIDDIDPFQRKRFFESLTAFFDESFRERDQATVLVWDGRLRVVLPPTGSREQLNAVMEVFSQANAWSEEEVLRHASEARVQAAESDAAFFASLGVANEALAQALDPEDEIEFQEFLSSEDRCARIRRKVRQLESITTTFARVDMQHVMLFASDDLSLRPGGQCSTRHDLDQLAATANAYGITIHALHPPGHRDRRVGYGPDSTRFGTGLPGMTAQSQSNIEAMRAFEQADGLVHLADLTGGLTAIGPGMTERVLQRASVELDNYYSIGYRFSPGKEDRPRRVEVKTKNRAYRVRTRSAVMRLSEGARLRDDLAANLYLPPPDGPQSPDFEVAIRGITRNRRLAVVHLLLSIRSSDLLVLAGSDETRKGSFSVFSTAGSELGDASPVSELQQDFIAEADIPPRILYVYNIQVRPSTRRLSIAVRDNLSGDVAKKIVELPPPDAQASR